MNLVLVNVLLALIWAALGGDLSTGRFVEGMVLGFVILAFSRTVLGPTNYFAKAAELPSFLAFFLKEFVLAQLRVAYDVVTPRHRARPGIIGLPLDARGDVEITVLAMLISLTPGTLALDISTDRRVLYIHAMFVDPADVGAVARHIKQGLERRLLSLFR